jgi:integrase
MPDETPVEKRDRALLAFAILTGARDNAIASTRLKHLDLVEGRLFQDGRDMRTKFGKSFPTFFFPVGDDVEAIVRDWVEFLQNNEGFGPDDPLFPPIKSGFDSDGNFAADGFERRCWANADPIRAIFRKAFEGAGLPYFNPHSLRKTLMQLGLGLHLGADGLKAWSQNYGHDDIITTLKSYGDLPEYRQRDLMRSAGTADSDEALASRLGWEMLRRIREAGGK